MCDIHVFLCIRMYAYGMDQSYRTAYQSCVTLPDALYISSETYDFSTTACINRDDCSALKLDYPPYVAFGL